jgi:hypothetical protein
MASDLGTSSGYFAFIKFIPRFRMIRPFHPSPKSWILPATLWDSSLEAGTLQPGDAVTVRIILTQKEIRKAIEEAAEEEESKCVLQ